MLPLTPQFCPRALFANFIIDSVDFHAMDDQSVVYSDQPPTATGAAKDEDKYGRGGQPQQPYGRRLVECVRDVFKYSTIMNGSK